MIRLENVNKYFNKHKKNQIHVINNTSLTLDKTGLVALLGPSGCGKTTLLNVIGGLDKIDSGNIYINGNKISNKSSRYIDKIRNLDVGYIFQDFNLIDNMSVFDNVALSLKINGINNKKEISKRVEYVLNKVGMYKYRNKYTSMLSGGQRQRVAIARAIVKDPAIIIADEPTGNLDSKNTLEVMNIIKSISKNRLVILVTHENNIASFYASRIIRIQDGQIIDDIINEHSDELDYRIDNKIYLKDIKNNKNFKNENLEINCYYEDIEKDNIKINLIINNGNIYIESNKYKIQAIDNSSGIEIINDNYKKIDKSIFEEYNFDFDNIIDKKIEIKYSSIFNIFSLINNGFIRVLNYPFLKKLLLLGFLASSMFITYSISSLVSINKVNESNFVEIDKNYLLIKGQKLTIDEFSNLERDSDIEYILPTNSISSFYIKLDNYYQTYISEQIARYRGSLFSSDILSDDDIIYGKKPTNKNEIVIDKIVYDNTYKEGYVTQAGILSYEDLVGKTFYVSNDLKYILVGISDTKNPSIYSYKSEFINILSNNNELKDYIYDVDLNDKKLYDYEIYKDSIQLIEGKYPMNDYEVIISDIYKYNYSLNDEIDYKVNGVDLKVVGFYKTNDYYVNYLTNNNTVKRYLIDNNTNMVIYSKDKISTIDKYKNSYNIKDSYEYYKKEYLDKKIESNKTVILIAIFILIISLIEIFFMIRASFLSRIKEIGIYRAIGMKKIDIYKIFAGEIISISTIAGISGILFMSYILYQLSTIDMINDKFTINIFVILISIMFTYIFNLLIGLLPVYKVISKTPAQILSRNDL